METSSPPPTKHQVKSRPHIAYLVAGYVLLLIFLSVVCWVILARLRPANAFEKHIETNNYQAVFITNGQAYFGKLSVLSDSGYKLSDVYYYQVENVNQQPNLSQPATDQKQNLSLAKLGNELHGPKDALYIEAKQVLFWENLKSDSKVVKAIKDYKAKRP